MKPLAGSSIFVDLMGKVSSIPVLGVVLGAVMTLVVQSSSATIAVLLSVSQKMPNVQRSHTAFLTSVEALFLYG